MSNLASKNDQLVNQTYCPSPNILTFESFVWGKSTMKWRGMNLVNFITEYWMSPTSWDSSETELTKGYINNLVCKANTRICQLVSPGFRSFVSYA